MTETLYQITWSKPGGRFQCFGIVVGPNGVVIATAPIAKWAYGEDWPKVRRWFERKGAKIVQVNGKDRVPSTGSPPEKPA